MKSKVIKQAMSLLESLNVEEISDIQMGTFDNNRKEHTSIDIVTNKADDKQ